MLDAGDLAASRIACLGGIALRIDLKGQLVQSVVIEIARIAARIRHLHPISEGVVFVSGDGVDTGIQRNSFRLYPPGGVVAVGGDVVAGVGARQHATDAVIGRSGGGAGVGVARDIAMGLADYAPGLVVDSMGGDRIGGCVGRRAVGDLTQGVEREPGVYAHRIGDVVQASGRVVGVDRRGRGGRQGADQGGQAGLSVTVGDRIAVGITDGPGDQTGRVVLGLTDIAFGVDLVDGPASAVIEGAADPVVVDQCSAQTRRPGDHCRLTHVGLAPAVGVDRFVPARFHHIAGLIIDVTGDASRGVDAERQPVRCIVRHAGDPLIRCRGRGHAGAGDLAVDVIDRVRPGGGDRARVDHRADHVTRAVVDISGGPQRGIQDVS